MNKKTRWLNIDIMITIVFFLFGAAHAAIGDMVSNFGLGANALSMSGAYTAVADDFSATYYNPAGLAYEQRPAFAHDKKGTSIYVGTGLVNTRLWIKDPGVSPSYQPISRLSFAQLGLTIGPSALGGLLSHRRIYFGFALYSPTDVLIGWKKRNTSTDRYFVFYDNENRKFGFLADIAYKFGKFISLGAGVNVLAASKALVYVNFIQSGFTHAETDLILIKAAPVAGIMINLKNGFKFGFTYRGEIKFKDYGNVNLNSSGTPLFSMSYSYTKFFSPRQYASGISYLFPHSLLASIDATYINWSDFVDEQGDGKPQTRLFDTIVPRAGIRYAISNNINVSGGYAFLPSPVKDQTGVTNFLDSNKHLISAGAGYTFAKAGFWQGPITISAYVQDTIFQTRNVHKTQPVQQYRQGYSFGGYVFDGGIQAKLSW